MDYARTCLKFLSLLLIFHQSFAQTTRPSHENVTCESVRPVGCTDDPPSNCPPERVQRWLPQSNIGVPFACGSCYYCRERPITVEKEACPIAVCPVISPLCSDTQPVIIEHDGRRCRGCSECLSYNTCPTPTCPRRIRGCDLYGPNFRYIDGQLCQDCRVCMRYKGGFIRPPQTPLPCQAFNVSECPLVSKCVTYQDRYVNMGEGRECQVCPECLEWADPNEGIPSFNLGGDNTGEGEGTAATALPFCDNEARCHRPTSCQQFEVIYRIRNGSACRDCDRCVSFKAVTITDGGNDGPTTSSAQQSSTSRPVAQTTTTTTTTTTNPTTTTFTSTSTTSSTTTAIPVVAAAQACPDLSFCPSMEDCTTRVVNRTTKIVDDEVCPACPTCEGDNSQCPTVRCPGRWCQTTAIYTQLINGMHCGVCVCNDRDQDCSDLTCPPVPTSCTKTVTTPLIVLDHICQCEVCDTRSPTPVGVDGGSDGMSPDVRDSSPNIAIEPAPATRETTPLEVITTAIPTTEGLPNCDTVMPELQCGQADCFLVFSDVLTIDGVDCLGCQRCANGIQSGGSCPPITCPALGCGDNEDVAAGRMYRESRTYNVSGEMCAGCDMCLDCPVAQCLDLDPSCIRYARRTDNRGCVVCPVCELWRRGGNGGPAITGRSGLIQSMSTAMCLTANGNFSNELPGLKVDTCAYDEIDLTKQNQVFTLTANGLLMDANSGLCAAYFSPSRPFVMRICNTANGDMIWTVETSNQYPQFFRFKLPYRNNCMDVFGNSSLVAGTAVSLWDCEEFQRFNGIWSDQWWKFEDFITSQTSTSA